MFDNHMLARQIIFSTKMYHAKNARTTKIFKTETIRQKYNRNKFVRQIFIYDKNTNSQEAVQRWSCVFLDVVLILEIQI